MLVSERERLLTLLFDKNGGRELVNIKFFQGNAADLTVEQMSTAVRRVVENLWSDDVGLMSVMPEERVAQRSVSDIMAAA